MAQRVVLTDDLDGSEATQTLSYMIEGQEYEIDLSEENVQQFQQHLSPLLRVAAKLQGRLHRHDGGVETEGGEVVRTAGMTSRKSGPGLKQTATK
jgi:Lsr2